MKLIRTFLTCAAIVILVLCLAPSSPALADDERPEDNRGTEFQRVRGPIRESVPGGVLLVVAYGIVWAAAFGYIGMQWRRQGKLSEDLGRLEKTLESGDAAKSSTSAQ